METAVNLVQDGAPILGERVLVLGQGMVGLLTASLLSEFPLESLTVVDQFELRREALKVKGHKSKVESVAHCKTFNLRLSTYPLNSRLPFRIE
jgi:threonine dehydrogenase-like Zn-dependent dehydrogenase